MAVEVAVAIERSRPRFFLVLALVCLAIVVAGFGPTFFFRPLSGATDYATGYRSLPFHIAAHGFALTAWFALFAVQAALVARGRTGWHRRVGVAGVVVAVAVVATSVVAQVGFPARTIDTMTAMGAPPAEIDRVLRQLVVGAVASGFAGLVLFACCFVAGVLVRSSSASHKRWMLLASLALLPPALSPGRFLGQVLAPFPSTLLHLACLGALVWYDLATRRRLHAATGWGLVGNALVIATLVIATRTDFGLAYTRWLASFWSELAP